MLYHCDLDAGNKWTRTGTTLPGGAGPGTGLIYDEKLDVMLVAYQGTSGPTKLWIMKYVPKNVKGEK